MLGEGARVDLEAEAGRAGYRQLTAVVGERLGEDAVARLGHPAGGIQWIFELLFPGEAAGGQELQVHREADAIGPGVRRVAEAVLSAELGDLQCLRDAAREDRVGLEHRVALPLDHHAELREAAGVELAPADGHAAHPREGG